MKIPLSTGKPIEPGHYIMKYKGRISQVYVGIENTGSSWSDLPFSNGLSVTLKSNLGDEKSIPIAWIYNDVEWSEKLEF